MRSNLTTEYVREAVVCLDILTLSIVRRRHFHNQYQVAVLINFDGIHHGFVGRSRPGLCRVLRVDECFEVRVSRYVGCCYNNCKSDS